MQAVFRDEIKEVHQRIAEKIGGTQYQVWFKQAIRLTMNENRFEVVSANPFISNWIEGHFQPAIAEAVTEVYGQALPIRFQIDSSLLASGEKTAPAPMKAQRAVSALKRTPAVRQAPGTSPLKLTLDTFVVGPKNQLAYNTAMTVVREEKSPFNPLFLHGGYGIGKTHLLQGICNQVHQSRPGSRWLYLSAEDFANQYVVALKTHKLDIF
ncbi:MAG: hypothetical protein LLF96_10965, partial [Eubacteriales bacterium]|nr:hypothetical protein [Eubacteriales bacterium]